MTDTTNQQFDDILLTCKDCNCEYVWEKGEQMFYNSKKLAQPLRCPACRKLRKATINKPYNTNADGEVDGNRGSAH